MNLFKIFTKKIKLFRENTDFDFKIIKKNINPEINFFFQEPEFKFKLKEKKLFDEENIVFNEEKASFNSYDIITKKPSDEIKVTFIKKLFIFFILIFSINLNAFEKIGEGLFYEKINFINENGPQVIHIVKLRKDSPKKLRVALAEFSMFSTKTVSDIAGEFDARVAVNAAFFNWTGEILGTLIMNHKIISLPIYSRSVFCIGEDGNYFITVPDINPHIKFKDYTVEVDGINQHSYENKIIVYTPEYGRFTKTEKHGLEFVVIKNRVVEKYSRNAVIPPDGFVVAVHDDENQKKFENINLFHTIEFGVSYDSELEDIKYAVGGGPSLIKDNKVHVAHIEERFKPNFVNQRAPRTAVGMNAQGHLFLVTLDGRQPGHSIGMTLKEFAQWLYEYGLTEALNLDGGGSTAMVIDNYLKNSPSGGQPRKVNGAIIIEKVD
ncbi:MAG: phosphodiester glycosidase family protein [Candidatus Muiribacteriota bacterium]